jgi:hypothetical protein
LLSGLAVARNVTLFGNQYITIGDGTVQLVQSKSGVPILVDLERNAGSFDVELNAYPTSTTSIGSLATPNIKENTTQYINSGQLDSFELTERELREFLSRGPSPVLFEDDLAWSDNLIEERFS